jgi:hypothetical protein
MKKTLKSAGAVGLAAATILTGLSFGPAASAVTTAGRPSITAGFTLYDSKSRMTIAAQSARMGQLIPAPYGGAPARYDMGAVGEVSVIRDAATQLCMTRPAATFGHITGETCTDSAAQQWIIQADGKVQAPGAAANDQLGNAVGVPGQFNKPFMYYFTNVTDRTYALRMVDAAPSREVLTASVVTTDAARRSAVITGTGVAGATVMIGDEDAEVAANNTWTITVTGLALGSNPLTVTQWENGVQTDEVDLDAPIAVSPVTVTTTFPTDHTQEAVASGTAFPGATVIVRDAAGDEIDRTTAGTDDTGAWSMEIPAPNAGGDYGITAYQEIDGAAHGDAAATIAYGAAVAMSTPVDDAEHDGGPVRMTGTGEAHAQITVREQGDDTAIGSTTALVNGNWTLNTTPLNDRRHVLEVTQTGKGNNVTTSTITLNPEAVDTPVTVTNPANPADGYTPNTPFTFEGTATAGKAVTVENKWGTHLGNATMNGENWSWTRTNMGTTTWQLRFVQDKGQPAESVAEVMDFKPNAAPAPLVVVTNPANVADGYTPNTSFTFRGTATHVNTKTADDD